MTRVVSLTIYMHGQTALVTVKRISMKCEVLKRHRHKMATGSQNNSTTENTGDWQ
jgi:hypothetical protein